MRRRLCGGSGTVRGHVPETELRFVYYESRKQELKIILMNEGRCDERRKFCLLRRNKTRTKQKTCKSVGVMKD